MANAPSRRKFLQTMPLAGLAGLASTTNLSALAQAPSTANTSTTNAVVPFQLFRADMLQTAAAALASAPGNKNLIDTPSLPIALVMTTEAGKSAAEFERHEGRDHLFQVIDGSTIYEVGGTMTHERHKAAGEWLSPDSDGSTKLSLSKGDMLLIPRGTPHRRRTAERVTFLLISSSGSLNTHA